ncbi:MAG: MoaD/ThiS family protein [Deltaproteobacteria bacterium]|nr:MoaD/ThiS family protein [Deltaproteobacteria bacterium]
MRIRVKPAGIIRRYVEEMDMEVPAGFTIRGLIALLAIPAELKLMVFVNGQRKDADEILEDGNEVRLITLLSGG